MILVDANVLMYAAGAEHPFKRPSVAFLESVATGEVDGAVDTEVLQELLHRYRAIDRWREGREVFDRARQLFDVILPIDVHCVDEARRLLDLHPRLSARDALHGAVVRCFGLDGICTYDRGFEGIDGVRRHEP
ncbi:MAG TPA: type II toxin-antitoxin system VapC family toxin [Thermoanaerobaculia bacterium]|nr:type II toxin-antitoxin system VapC family toxin [Thermoanaerobaculia bacterium]